MYQNVVAQAVRIITALGTELVSPKDACKILSFHRVGTHAKVEDEALALLCCGYKPARGTLWASIQFDLNPCYSRRIL